jgi:16S rRNA (uracil1498-N3)-methyltransferase
VSLRLYVDVEPGLRADLPLDLPAAAARHVQVLRLQPGSELTLFDGRGGEWSARVVKMGRSDVQVVVGEFHAVERELSRQVTLAVGMPANERFDWLIEKATELGAAAIQPLMTERSVLRVSGERAEKKRAHWQAIAAAAAEQCGRNRVTRIHPVQDLTTWMSTGTPAPGGAAHVLSLAPTAGDMKTAFTDAPAGPLLVLSGPEGGLSTAEEQLAQDRGFAPLGLGARVLRAETAPLLVLAGLAALGG